ncbi:hypothetical protein QC764_510590 [Podospora pseudoanserina]|uniref:AAA+ ATPase domain-containing protein n=1 Tax=Podospora pseudoanserina TaxID=2609844 RepID=A0ABR0I901_9PEZI|nr:hypothetical protein QC764_510590 [Podospora pseudoanserina]
MPVPRKDMIKALVQKYTNMSPTPGLSTSWRADFIENKGEGHIFLLHGGPGVGKTYTAECIAEYTYCPLLSLTCGDIGTDDVKMEQQLSKWFRLAEKWGAVMLIDEADIYLERRVVSDLRRNSLVFGEILRWHPHLSTPVVLTLNVQILPRNPVLDYKPRRAFDDAFISRIHIIIKYDQLSKDNHRQIWTQFFDKLTDERQGFIITGRAK